jgi:hypothetical protein
MVAAGLFHFLYQRGFVLSFPTRIAATAALAFLLVAPLTVEAAQPPTDGLVEVDSGAAAYYSPSWDGAGWNRIIENHLSWGQADPNTFRWDDGGHYCVQPDYGFGDVITLRNSDTGQTMLCTIGDTVAPRDLGYWRSRFVVEMSHAAFMDLGLNDGNHVEVWVMPNG